MNSDYANVGSLHENKMSVHAISSGVANLPKMSASLTKIAVSMKFSLVGERGVFASLQKFATTLANLAMNLVKD